MLTVKLSVVVRDEFEADIMEDSLLKATTILESCVTQIETVEAIAEEEEAHRDQVATPEAEIEVV